MGLKMYSSLMKKVCKDRWFSTRKAVAQEALEKGIKPTARRFNMSKNTVRTWMRRFLAEGNDGCIDRRNGPNHIPHKTSETLESHVVTIRRVAKCYGAKRLKYYFRLTPSISAIHRIIRAHGLTRKKRRRYQKKNDLRAVKARYLAFEKLQMDVKYLTDIPPYWEAMQKYRLPRFQYTVRDVKSGMLFLGFADEVSELHAETMARHVLKKIMRNFAGAVTIQTDNGVEFSGTTRRCEYNQFRKAVNDLGVNHIYIPPGHCNANADVESIHATIEEEFYDLTPFTSREDFLQKAESYRLFYNIERPNSSKGGKTPWLITQQDHPDTDIATVIQLASVVDLDHLLRASPGGQGLPVLPVSRFFLGFLRKNFY